MSVTISIGNAREEEFSQDDFLLAKDGDRGRDIVRWCGLDAYHVNTNSCCVSWDTITTGWFSCSTLLSAKSNSVPERHPKSAGGPVDGEHHVVTYLCCGT